MYHLWVRYYDVSMPNHYSKVLIRKFDSKPKALAFMKVPKIKGLHAKHVVALTKRLEKFNYDQPIAFVKVFEDHLEFVGEHGGDFKEDGGFWWGVYERRADVPPLLETTQLDRAKELILCLMILQEIEKFDWPDMLPSVRRSLATAIAAMRQRFFVLPTLEEERAQVAELDRFETYEADRHLVKAITALYLQRYRLYLLGDFVREVNSFLRLHPHAHRENLARNILTENLTYADIMNNLIINDATLEP